MNALRQTLDEKIKTETTFKWPQSHLVNRKPASSCYRGGGTKIQSSGFLHWVVDHADNYLCVCDFCLLFFIFVFYALKKYIKWWNVLHWAAEAKHSPADLPPDHYSVHQNEEEEKVEVEEEEVSSLRSTDNSRFTNKNKLKSHWVSAFALLLLLVRAMRRPWPWPPWPALLWRRRPGTFAVFRRINPETRGEHLGKKWDEKVVES